jgi:hypothetical protein
MKKKELLIFLGIMFSSASLLISITAAQRIRHVILCRVAIDGFWIDDRLYWIP